jgi:hypothetical protein
MYNEERIINYQSSPEGAVKQFEGGFVAVVPGLNSAVLLE